MKRKIGINANCFRDSTRNYEDFIYSHIEKLGKVGFEHFFIGSNDGDFAKYRSIADRMGMSLDFIHAPFRGINNFWLEGDDYLELYNGMKLSVDLAAEYSIPMVIYHVSSGWEPPATCELGFSRYDSLVDYAEEKKDKAEDSDWVVKQSGAMIYFGTKDAVKAAKCMARGFFLYQAYIKGRKTFCKCAFWKKRF